MTPTEPEGVVNAGAIFSIMENNDKQLLPVYNEHDTYDLGEEANDVLLISDSTSTQWTTDPINQKNTFSKRILRFGLFLLPSFIAERWNPPLDKKPDTKNGSIDGLRGLGALFVLNFHLAHLWKIRAYGYPSYMNIPFVATLWDGKQAVNLFFVISGYALSLKSVKLMRSRQNLKFQKAITSSVLRRIFRLCLPPLIAACFMCVLTILGAYDQAMIEYKEKVDFVATLGSPPIRNGTWSQIEGLGSTAEYLTSTLIPWGLVQGQNSYFVYERATWTIPVELKCSMALFLWIVGTARLYPVYRLTATFVLITYVYLTERYRVGLFFAGMMLAELDLIRQKFSTDSAAKSIQIGVWKLDWTRMDAFWVPAFFIGWFSYSSSSEQQLFTPQTYLGTIFMMWSASSSIALNPLFTNPVVAYLGRISYSLYLCHGTVIRCIGYHILGPSFALVTGTPAKQDAKFFKHVNQTQASIGFLLGAIIIHPLCIWYADIFTRAVDEPCVRFAHWFEQQVNAKDDEDVDDKQGFRPINTLP